jgi:hypothetical protein
MGNLYKLRTKEDCIRALENVYTAIVNNHEQVKKANEIVSIARFANELNKEMADEKLEKLILKAEKDVPEICLEREMSC